VFTLFVLIALLILSYLLPAWAIVRAARAVGSARARTRVGLLAMLIIIVISILLLVVGDFLALRITAPVRALLLYLTLFAAQLCAVFMVLRRAFDLSPARTFAPWGAYIAAILVQLGLAVWIVRPFLTQAFITPSSSMSPTLEPRDRFCVNKLLHPRRWDLVAYWNHVPEPVIYCKRLIGLPGERLRFENGNLYVNDQPVVPPPPPPLLARRLHASPGSAPTATRYKEGETIILGPNEYFFIGDNVDASADSRWYGPTDRGALIGVVDLIYWPPRKIRIVR
jgi:signal peptidase I